MSDYNNIIESVIKLAKHTKNRDFVNLGMGMYGEQAIRDHAIKEGNGYAVMQVDLIVQIPRTVKYRLLEIKCQERFLAPPFDGHGLPIWQFDTRLRFEERTEIEAWLYVIEPEVWINNRGQDLVIYRQSFKALKELPAERKFITKRTKRIIFPMDAFERIIIPNSLPSLDGILEQAA
jgi:hypothetical protein